MIARLALLAVLLAASVAGAQPVPPGPGAEAVPALGRLVPDDAVTGGGIEADFSAWLAGFRTDELAKGVSPAALDAVVVGLRYSPRVVELDRAQPDDSGRVAVFASYLDRHVEPVLIARGRGVHADLADLLAANEAATGVPGAVVLAIWGMESSFGVVTGSFDVPRSLATLAFDGRRRELFTRELDAVVRIVASGRIGRDRLTGSWAGAMGQPQFLPSTYLAYARDGDGDGRADIWTSRADVALSVATKLAADGWRRGQGWGIEVTVPGDLDRTRVRNLVAPATCTRVLAKHSRWLTIAEWRALGVVPVPGAAAWPAVDVLATLVEPDGAGGHAFLTFGNYRALLGYNCSNFYALSAGVLSDALR